MVINIKTYDKKYRNLSVFLCNNETVDAVYYALKAQVVHFSIVQLVHDKISFLNRIIDLVPIYGVFNASHIHVPIEINEVNALCDTATHALFIWRCTSLNSNIFIAAELSIDHIISGSYTYKYSYHTMENEFRKFPIYGDSLIDTNTDTILVVEKSNGYGDALITMPLLQKVTDDFLNRGIQVVVLHYYHQSYDLSYVFLNRCQNRMCDYMDNRKQLSQIYHEKRNLYQQIYNFDGYIVRSASTKLYEIASLLNYTDFDTLLDDISINTQLTSSKVFTSLEIYKKEYRYIIGVQFKTDHDDICFCKRSWSNEHINKFISLCNENKIGCVNLAPCNGIKWNNHLDYGHLPVNQLFGIVQHLDLVIGIDSFGGHMAAALRVPNVTIWGKPLKDKSQRPICMNYSIVSKDGNIDSLQTDVVFDRMLKILSGLITLSGKIRPNNAVDNYNTEWLI